MHPDSQIVQERLHRLMRLGHSIENALLISKLEAEKNSEIKTLEKKLHRRSLLRGAAAAAALSAFSGAGTALGVEALHQRWDSNKDAATKMTKNFLQMLGLGKTANIHIADKYNHYPQDNPSYGLESLHVRSQPFYANISRFAMNVNGAEYFQSKLEDFYVDQLSNTLVSRRNGTTIGVENALFVASAKTNKATELMVGYNTQREANGVFRSPDARWYAKGLWKLNANESQEIIRRDKKVYRAGKQEPWTTFGWSGAYIDEMNMTHSVAPYFASKEEQVTDFFLITKLQAPRELGYDQTIVLVEAAHGWGANAAAQLFSSDVIDNVCYDVVSELVDKLGIGFENWQLLACASGFDHLKKMCTKIEKVGINQRIKTDMGRP